MRWTISLISIYGRLKINVIHGVQKFLIHFFMTLYLLMVMDWETENIIHIKTNLCSLKMSGEQTLKVLMNWSYDQIKFRNQILKSTKFENWGLIGKCAIRDDLCRFQIIRVKGMSSKLLVWFSVPWRCKLFQKYFWPFWRSRSTLISQNGHLLIESKVIN